MGEILDRFRQIRDEMNSGSLPSDINASDDQSLTSNWAEQIPVPAYDDPREQAIMDSRKRAPTPILDLFYREQAKREIEDFRRRNSEAFGKINLEARNPFLRGLYRGFDNLQGTYQGGLGMLSSLAGDEPSAQQYFQAYKDEMRQASENPRDNIDFFSTDPKTGAFGSFSNFGTYAAGTLGEAVPSLAESVLTGIAGAALGAAVVPAPDPLDVATVPIGAVGGVFAKGAIKKAISNAAAEYVKRGMAAEAAEGLAKQYVGREVAKRFGSAAATTAVTGLHEGGGMYMEGREAGYDSPGTAMGLGLASGLSESLLGAAPGVLKSFAGRSGVDEIARREGWRAAAGYLWDTAKASGEEGVQEGFQEFLGSLNKEINDPKSDLFNKENFMQWAEAAAGGALVGGAVKSGTTGVELVGLRGGRGGRRGADSSTDPFIPQLPPGADTSEDPSNVQARLELLKRVVNEVKTGKRESFPRELARQQGLVREANNGTTLIDIATGEPTTKENRLASAQQEIANLEKQLRSMLGSSADEAVPPVAGQMPPVTPPPSDAFEETPAPEPNAQQQPPTDPLNEEALINDEEVARQAAIEMERMRSATPQPAVPSLDQPQSPVVQPEAIPPSTDPFPPSSEQAIPPATQQPPVSQPEGMPPSTDPFDVPLRQAPQEAQVQQPQVETAMSGYNVQPTEAEVANPFEVVAATPLPAKKISYRKQQTPPQSSDPFPVQNPIEPTPVDAVSAPTPSFQPEVSEKLKEAIRTWKGSPSNLKRYLKVFLEGGNVEGGNVKEGVELARAFVDGVAERSKAAPTLYRGDNKDPSKNDSPYLGWTSDKKQAEKWAKEYGGTVYTKEGAVGLEVKSLGLFDADESEWIVPNGSQKISESPDAVSGDRQREEVQDARGTKGGGDPNVQVQTEGGQRPSEGQISPMEEQAADEAPSPVFPEPSAEPMPTEYTSIKQNASGVAQTIRASRGDRVLLIEKSKDSGTWTVRQAGSKSWDFEASNISDQKKAKDIAERVFEGAFDKDDDKRFTQTDSGSMSYSNEKLAGLWNVAQGESLAATLKATGYYTDGRVLIKAPDKDRDAILASSKKRSGIEGIGREVKVESVIAPTRNTIKPGNEMTVVGYRGGDMSERQVMLKNDSGDYVLLSKAYHDTILKRHPKATIYGEAKKGNEITTPVVYAVNGEVVGLLMPLSVPKVDTYLADMIAGTYDFAGQKELPKPRSVKKKAPSKKQPAEQPPKAAGKQKKPTPEQFTEAMVQSGEMRPEDAGKKSFAFTFRNKMPENRWLAANEISDRLPGKDSRGWVARSLRPMVDAGLLTQMYRPDGTPVYAWKGTEPTSDLVTAEDFDKAASQQEDKPEIAPAQPEVKAKQETKESPAKTYLRSLNKEDLQDLARELDVKATEREDIVDEISDKLNSQPTIREYLETAAAKAKPSRKKKRQAAPRGESDKDASPPKKPEGKEIPSKDFTEDERKQKQILNKIGITLRLVEGSPDQGVPGLFIPNSRTIWLVRNYVEKWDSLLKKEGRPEKAMTWGLFAHEMFHAIKRSSPKAWRSLYNWVSKNDSVGLGKAKVAYLADMKEVDAGYYERLLEDEDLLNDEGLSRYLEDRAAYFKFWNDLGKAKPGLLARIGRWVRRVLRFAEPGVTNPNTLAGQTRQAIERAMKRNNVAMKGKGGRRAAPARGKEEFSEKAFTPGVIEKVFGVPKDVATAVSSIAEAMGLDKSRIQLVKGGMPAENALFQVHKILSGEEPVAVQKTLKSAVAWIGEYANQNKVVPEGVDFNTSDGRQAAVDAIVKHTLLEINAWKKLNRSYISFYTTDIIDRANPWLSKWAKRDKDIAAKMAAEGRDKLTDDEVKLLHIMGSFSSANAIPSVDTLIGLMVLKEWMLHGTLTGMTSNPKHVWKTDYNAPRDMNGQRPRKPTYVTPRGKITFESSRVTSSGKKIPNEPNLVPGKFKKISRTFNLASARSFSKLVDHFGGGKSGLAKAIKWMESEHTWAEIVSVIGDKAAKKLKVHEYLKRDLKNPNDPNLKIVGAFALGDNPKQGSYILNRWQKLKTITKDMWVARTMSRYFREPNTGVPWKHTNQLGRIKRQILEDAWVQVAETLGVEPAIVQEMMWDMEKLFYGMMGVSTDTSYPSDGVLRSLTASVKASVELTDSGIALMRAFNKPTVADGIHELGHVARMFLFDKSIPKDMREGITDADIDVAMKWSGVVDGNWTTEAEEKFANGLLKYIKGGKFTSKTLRSVFEKVVSWLRKIYKSIDNKTSSDPVVNLEISPAMQEVYGKLVSRGIKDSQLSWEAIPSKTLDIIPEIHNASYAVKKEYLKRITDVLFKNGDWIAKAVGLDVPVTITGFSAWQGDIGAGSQSKFEVMLENNGGVKTITEEYRKKLDLYANILGYVLSQDGVYWHLPVYSSDPALENGFEITGNRAWKGSEFKDLYDAMLREFGKDTDLAPAFMPNGARILNFSIDNLDFHSRMEKVVSALHGSNPSFLGGTTTTKSFRSEGNEYNATSNSWQSNPNGEEYTSRIGGTGRPDLQRRSDNVRQAVISATRKFAREQGWNTEFTAAPIKDSGQRYSPGRRSESTGDGRGRDQGRSYTPLEGSPSVQGASGPDPGIVDAAEQYARDNGINLKRQAKYVRVDEERAKRIAQAFEEMQHSPNDPAVKEAYDDMIRQTKSQYDALVKAGYTFTFYDGDTDPYDGNPSSAVRDLRQNKKMAVYGTYAGYGTEGITATELANNPMLADTGLRWKDQKGVSHPVAANDLFRAVHDAFGHSMEGAGFRARGEENAWQAHVRLYYGPAIGAMTSETRGQNSWLNFGPYAEKNKTASVLDTVFAENKIGLMPEWTWTEGRAADMEETGDEGVRYSPSRQAKRKRDPEITKAAQDLKAGLIDRNQYQRIVDMRMPLRKFDEVPIPASKEDMLRGLGDRKAGDRLKRDLIQNPEDIAKGRLLETRLDIPAYDDENVWVVSLHEPRPDLNKGSAGRVVAYTPTSVLRNVTFGVTENAALNIAAGKPKSTIATMRGEYVPMTAQQAYKLAETNKDRWVEIGMNPIRHTYFYDKDTQTPVVSAEEVVQVGGMVLAKNPVLGRREDYRYSPGRNNDAKYLAAVDQGDMAKAQRMVDAAAAGAGEVAGGVSPVLYHGSPHSNFYEFQIPSKGFNSTVFGSYEVSRNAAFFTTDEEAASRYREQGGRKGGSVRKFRVFGELLDWRNGITDAQFNTLVSKGVNSRWLDRKGASWELFDKEEDPDGTLVKAIQKMGYDGVIIKDTDGTSDFDAYVAFTPSQIKSSDAVTYDDSGNVVPLSKRFDETLPDVRYSPRRKPKDDILAGLYKRLEEEGLIKPQVREPSPPASDETTGTKNVKTNELRALAGLGERVMPERESVDQWQAEAARRIAKTPGYPARLAEELANNPRAIDRVEEAVLGRYIRDLENRRQAGESVLDEILTATEASEKAGSIWGQTGVSRQVELASDFSVAGLVRRHLREVQQRPTESQLQEYAQLADRIKKLEAQNAKLVEELAKETIARKKAEAAAQPEPEKPKLGTKRATVVKKVADAFSVFQNLWSGGNRPAAGRNLRPQTDTPEFKKWFGDSKVVDADGKPLVVYHGTNAEFDVFEDTPMHGMIWFAIDKELAAQYGEKVLPVYLKVNEWDKDGGKWQVRGRDVIWVRDKSQIKSATGNRGTFDPNNPDIRYSPSRQPNDIKAAANNVVSALREAGVSSILEVEAQIKANLRNASPEQIQAIRDAWNESISKNKPESPIGDNPTDSELGARAKELMRAAVELGYGAEEENWKDVVDVVYEQLSTEVPGISKYETMQAMSDYGVWQSLNTEPVEVIIRAIRGKARQSLKIEDTINAIKQSEEWLNKGVTPEEVARRLREKGLLPKATGQERATPDSIERELISQFNKLKKTLPVPAESKEGQLKSALTTAKTAAKNRLEMLDKDIAALDEAVKSRTKLVKPVDEKTPLEPDEDLLDLRSQLEQKRRVRDKLKADYEKIFPPTKPKKGRKPLTEEQRLDASVRMLERQISAVKADVKALEDGTWAPAAKNSELTSERKEELMAELRSLRQLRKVALEANPVYQATEELKYWQRYRKAQERRLAFWQRRLEEAKAGRIPVPLKKRTITEKAILEKNMEIEEVQYDAMIAIEKAKRATWNTGQWIGQGILEATSLIPKTLMLGLEMSFVLRQGFFYTYSQPMKAFYALMEAIPAVFSQRLALESADGLKSRPNAKEYELAKVDFTQVTGPQAKLEELYQSAIIRWLENTETKLLLPLRTWAKLYAMAERGNRTFSNIMKADMYDIQKRDTLAAREFFKVNTGWTEDDIKETGRIANIFSGRGTGLKGGNPWLDWLFLARRWTWSRIQADFIVPFQLVTPQWIGQWNADRGMRVALAKLYIQAMVGHTAKMAVAYVAYRLLAGDDEEEMPTFEFDLRSSDALAMKIGETRFKDEGGLMPAIVLASRILTGKMKTSEGEIKSIYGDDVQYGGKTAADFIINYGRYKLGTAPSAILEWASGRDAVGNVIADKDDPTAIYRNIVGSRITPLTYREIYAAESELGLKRGTLAALEAFFGVSVSTHGSRSKYKKASEEDRKKQFEKDLEAMDYNTPDFGYKDLLTDKQRKQMFDQREAKKQAVVYAALANPQRKTHKSDESFQKSVSERDKAIEKFRTMGLDFNDARLMLLDYYKRQYGSAYEMRGNNYVLRESYVQRLRQLRKVLERK